MSRVTSDTEKMADLLTWGVQDTIWAVTNISFAMNFMLQLNLTLAVIVLLSLPVMILVSFKFRVKIYHHYRQSRKANSKMTAALNENITGVRVVKALRREAKNLEDFKVLSTNMYEESNRAVLLSAIYLPTIQTISAISLVLILWRGGRAGGRRDDDGWRLAGFHLVHHDDFVAYSRPGAGLCRNAKCCRFFRKRFFLSWICSRKFVIVKTCCPWTRLLEMWNLSMFLSTTKMTNQ